MFGRCSGFSSAFVFARCGFSRLLLFISRVFDQHPVQLAATWWAPAILFQARRLTVPGSKAKFREEDTQPAPFLLQLKWRSHCTRTRTPPASLHSRCRLSIGHVGSKCWSVFDLFRPFPVSVLLA